MISMFTLEEVTELGLPTESELDELVREYLFSFPVATNLSGTQYGGGPTPECNCDYCQAVYPTPYPNDQWQCVYCSPSPSPSVAPDP
jgi:hypothetical protein